ncbi:hypothetical protein BLNAU_20036 [Blattamonas nauphoetae]|uniref:Uncharacterized protein n=1 Tax=Blattamonas nauphoetae TaxID=2049346 RepID=A0ABQ9WZT4_9EUKA|nr:hypothetical protein BLNAU_20036 [Blattamonas nauphoetae]
MGRKEGICLSRGFTDSPCLHQIEDILGEEAKELLYTPQTRPGRSLPDTISKLPIEQQKGNIIRILSKCQHSHVSEQADIVFGTLSTDTILPITRTLPHPTTARSTKHSSQRSPILIVPFRLSAHSRCLRPHTTISSSSQRALVRVAGYVKGSVDEEKRANIAMN